MLFASIVNLICVDILNGSDQVHHVSTLLGLEVIPDSLPVLAALLIQSSVNTTYSYGKSLTWLAMARLPLVPTLISLLLVMSSLTRSSRSLTTLSG